MVLRLSISVAVLAVLMAAYVTQPLAGWAALAAAAVALAAAKQWKKAKQPSMSCSEIGEVRPGLPSHEH